MKTSVKTEVKEAPHSAPLTGVRILDLTRLLPGPLASLHLADLGADVIKIEDPVQGDYGRWMDPAEPQYPQPSQASTPENSSKAPSRWFLAINRNKRSVALDLKSAAGKQALLDLVVSADVVIEGFRPGVMDRLGLSYGTLKGVNPAVVLCSVSGYGQTGPLREKAGHDINYCALTGLLDQTGLRGGPPSLGNFQVADLAGGALSAVMGILSALYSVARGGSGRHIDISMTDCAGAHGIMSMTEWQAHGSSAPRGQGFLTGRLPNYAVYQTQDERYIAVGALETAFWSKLCEVLCVPELVHYDSTCNQDCQRVRDQLTAIFASQPQAHWTNTFRDIDCCTGPVLTLEEAMEDPQLISRGLFFTAAHPVHGDVTQFACPVKMSGFQFHLERHAPGLGEHNPEVLRDIGYNRQQIDAVSVKPA